MPLFAPLVLPNGQVLKNRLAKAAMEESMAEPGQLPGVPLQRLYRRWADGGAGLLITGNVMVAPDAMTGPGGLVLEAGTPLAPYRAWADAAHAGGAQVWMQINHPGRQVFAALGNPGWAPSAVPLALGKHSKMFAPVQALSAEQIAAIVQRFADTARAAEAAGFDGVQVHAAHGYLISQFLSPLSNRRTDAWGGSVEGRAKLLIDVLRAVRAAVRPGFAVAVKLNSADFQRGGFSEDDARAVVGLLNAEGVDLLELSGGSYESPAMQGRTADGRTLAREAYFLDFARELANVATLPVMKTGGIGRRAVAEAVLASGVDVVGLGTALAMQPDLPRQWAQDEAVAPRPVVAWRDKAIASLATMALVRRQLHRLGAGKSPAPGTSALLTLLMDRWTMKRLTQRYRAWRAATA
ncbi:MAG: NADH:flavin oxidoreductase/NADH oxidase family protein [Inhella sp.]|jgi:2,4-dienoyl-CoA reductase-like NADH-dependent reductase (Old Yellow Enzyme family)|uniref:NADH:flavin oxidoreductase/NADH oxidase family protein n=1 Tax=Inhella sp. TaxID=1921806 RepID=UPI0022C6FD49|nr:NADH:flavin oxidoreductase/NADH oxidase family protein [Inhella sp.]MCZ8235218.1 NADH:flavin oxidoreductase/NADH oxidase family protein [Inhella sp.]